MEDLRQRTAVSAIVAGAGTAQAKTVVLANSNGLSWGVNASTITGAYTQSTHSHSTAPAALYDGANSITSGTVVLANANGVSFSINGQTLSASVAAGATATGNLGAVSAAGGLISSGTVSFANGNGVSFTRNGQTISASIDGVSAGIGGIAAGTQTATSGTIQFRNSNNFTFGMSDSTRITASWAMSVYGVTNSTLGVTEQSAYALRFATSGNLNGGWNERVANMWKQDIGPNEIANIVAYCPREALEGFLAGAASAPVGCNGGYLSFAESNGVSFGLSTQQVTSYSGYGNNGFGSAGPQKTVNEGTITMSHDGFRRVSVFDSAGASTSASGSGLVFSASNNVTFGLNGQTITATVTIPQTTLSGYENFPMLNAATTTVTMGLGTWFFQPFVLQQNLASGRLNCGYMSQAGSSAANLRAWSGSVFASNSTGGATITFQDVWSYALWSRGAGANSTRLESFWSNTWGLSLTHSVCVSLTNVSHVRVTNTATLSYVANVGSNGAYTLAAITQGGSLSSAATNMNTTAISSVMSSMMNMVTGQIVIPVGFNTSLAPGMYWLGFGRSTANTTAGTSMGVQLSVVNIMGHHGLSAIQWRPFGLTQSHASTQHWPGAGAWSAVSAAPPGTVEFTDIRTFASLMSWNFNMVNISV